MQTPHGHERTDPLASFLAERSGFRSAAPLVATGIEVEIHGGLAIVSVTRRFRNTEPDPIEAAMTFPVPVSATLFALEARVGQRLLRGVARPRAAAREAYETSIDAGITAILHEEVLRGVHLLSVGPLDAGAEIEVTFRWVEPLAFVAGQGQLRIPMTVGEIYGASPLADCDDFLTGGAPVLADLSVRCSGGSVEWLDGVLDEGRGAAALDRPIDLIIRDPGAETLGGVTADGRGIGLRISQAAPGRGHLDLALLVDCSGSMDQVFRGRVSGATKHASAIAALAALAPDLRADDTVDLWEFNSETYRIGQVIPAGSEDAVLAARDRFRGLVAGLRDPSGGTEIGRALATAFSDAPARDILLITDGKSHALDVQALAREGHRVSAVLVGEDSLEANVGHLAALTGGDVFIGLDDDLAPTLAAAIASLRVPAEPVSADDGGLRTTRRDARIEVEWRDAPITSPATLCERAVAALVAALQLTMLDAEAATTLCEREGLVTHLTSLLLVDAAGAMSEGLPVLRKIALPAPRGADLPANDILSALSDPADVQMSFFRVRERIQQIERKALRKLKHPSRSRPLRIFLEPAPDPAPDSSPLATEAPNSGTDWQRLLAAFSRLDWQVKARGLAKEDLRVLPSGAAKMLLACAARGEFIAAAARLGLDPLRFTIGLVARDCAGTHRAAARVERVLFRGISPEDLAEALTALGDPALAP